MYQSIAAKIAHPAKNAAAAPTYDDNRPSFRTAFDLSAESGTFRVNSVMPRTGEVTPGRTMQAGIIDKLMPLHASNVAIWCPKHKGPAKVGYEIQDDKKVRVCRKCGEVL